MSFAVLLFGFSFVIIVFQIILFVLKSNKSRKSAKILRKFKQKLESNERKSFKINENLSFSRSEVFSGQLVLIFGWYLAKRRHLENYRNLYLNKGFDVLIIRTHLFDPIMPSFGSQITAQNVIQILGSVAEEYETIITHTFSAGCYQLGEVFVALKDNEDMRRQFHSSLKGSVFDSPVLYEDVADNMSKIVASNKITRCLVKNLMLFYMLVFTDSVTKHYKKSFLAVMAHPTKTPILDFLSPDDPFLNYDKILELAEDFRGRGVEVMVKSWPKSPHVGHYARHPEEYRQTLNQFLEKCINNNNSK